MMYHYRILPPTGIKAHYEKVKYIASCAAAENIGRCTNMRSSHLDDSSEGRTLG
jgi:hypothetical protein